MRRREFFTLLGGVVAARPLDVCAQRAEKVPRIGMLLPGSNASHADRVEAFREELHNLGYIEGKNVFIRIRFRRW
jgi:putative tryptophan/tyrosine transport system substrate-binding protein